MNLNFSVELGLIPNLTLFTKRLNSSSDYSDDLVGQSDHKRIRETSDNSSLPDLSESVEGIEENESVLSSYNRSMDSAEQTMEATDRAYEGLIRLGEDAENNLIRLEEETGRGEEIRDEFGEIMYQIADRIENRTMNGGISILRNEWNWDILDSFNLRNISEIIMYNEENRGT
jgi:hypothetical protein